MIRDDLIRLVSTIEPYLKIRFVAAAAHPRWNKTKVIA
jgi:hypothetical protein